MRVRDTVGLRAAWLKGLSPKNGVSRWLMMMSTTPYPSPNIGGSRNTISDKAVPAIAARFHLLLIVVI